MVVGVAMRSLAYGTFLIVGTIAGLCLAYPEPVVVQGPEQWTVDVRFDQPRQITLDRHGQGEPKRFWYMLVTLSNKTRQDVDFHPSCELMTDSFQILPAGKNTPPRVFELIKKRHKSRYPFIESLQQAGTKILQGQDNAKDIAIIWPDFDRDAAGVDIFISGLSNETVAIDHPIKPQKIYLRKTLELSYSLRGDPAIRSSLKPEFQTKRWVMR